jgi:large subunit ribosomal protein L23
MSLLSFTKKLSRKGDGEQRAAAETAKPDARPKTASVTALHPIGLALAPILTEKSVALQEQGVATIRVPQSATKHQVALAIAQRYGVKPRRVRMVRMLPRTRRRGTTSGRTAAWKKAYVTVDDVQKIVTGP